MNGKCNNKRTLFNLFEIFNCNGCAKKLTDETILIGSCTINIYYLNRNCLDFVYNDNDVSQNLYLKVFLRDMIENPKNIFIWLTINTIEEKKIINNDNFLFDLVSFEENIHIIVM